MTNSIILLCGSTGAGKTHYAKQLAKQTGAFRFAVDEWMQALFIPDLTEGIKTIEFDWATERIDRCEDQIWALTQQLLEQKQTVILEISTTTRALRDKQRKKAQATGFPCTLHFLDIDPQTRRQRVRQRNSDKGDTYCFEVTDPMFDFVEEMFERPTSDELEEAVIVTS